MNLIDLRNQIETLAWGPRGTDGLRAATASPSPVMVICAAFQDMRERTDLSPFETETLRECCKIIRANHFYGLTQDALEVQANLPPSPEAITIAGVDPNV
jgi:hypothetical protein